MTRTLGILGSGQVGSAVARLAVSAGWKVVLSNSRGPQTLGDLVSELGARARADTAAGAAAAGDLVVAAVPLIAAARLPQAALVGKVVIDTTNYAPDRDGRLAPLDSDELTSSELVQHHLPGARVVKAFNNITPRHLTALARPAQAPDRSGLPIAGADAAAKEQAVALLDGLGFDAVDLGGLAESWRFSPNTPLYAVVYAGEPMPSGADLPELLAWFASTPGGPVPATQIAELAADTVRAPAAVSFRQ